MGRHVVWAFGIVNPSGIGGCEARERRAEVGQDVGIGILLDHQRSGGMAQKQKKRAVARSGLNDRCSQVAPRGCRWEWFIGWFSANEIRVGP